MLRNRRRNGAGRCANNRRHLTIARNLISRATVPDVRAVRSALSKNGRSNVRATVLLLRARRLQTRRQNRYRDQRNECNRSCARRPARLLRRRARRTANRYRKRRRNGRHRHENCGKSNRLVNDISDYLLKIETALSVYDRILRCRSNIISRRASDSKRANRQGRVGQAINSYRMSR